MIFRTSPGGIWIRSLEGNHYLSWSAGWVARNPKNQHLGWIDPATQIVGKNYSTCGFSKLLFIKSELKAFKMQLKYVASWYPRWAFFTLTHLTNNFPWPFYKCLSNFLRFLVVPLHILKWLPLGWLSTKHLSTSKLQMFQRRCDAWTMSTVPFAKAPLAFFGVGAKVENCPDDCHHPLHSH